MVAMTPSEFRKGIDEMRKNGELVGERKSTEIKVVEAFDNGERNVKAIADMYGLSESTIYKYLYKHGRHFGGKTRIWAHSEKTLEIADDLKDGALSQYQIAKNHGVSRQYVTKVKHKLERGLLDYEQR
jgi:transposase